ncbi:hypothetical protein SDC9_54172 [bioreactor metagenome]|uniref:Uncharacterized protein n=1 Tax=bioreactor metagenome TaxID=1076179 RepID=A0A644X0Q0_9ZZZZ
MKYLDTNGSLQPENILGMHYIFFCSHMQMHEPVINFYENLSHRELYFRQMCLSEY